MKVRCCLESSRPNTSIHTFIWTQKSLTKSVRLFNMGSAFTFYMVNALFQIYSLGPRLRIS
jgi:hypothetical protein